jgi:cyclic beta-1,2-glucan synthetase
LKKNKVLKINGATVDLWQLQNYLEKVATNHNIKMKSDINTYPVPRLKENYEFIKNVYNLLEQHLKLGINIHPAGEWILDNLYIIEKAVKSIEKELSVKKYSNFVGLQSGEYAGFARIYVLACEIVAHTDYKIDSENLEKCLQAYQSKKNLDMEEIWNIGIFLNIAIIEKIKEICEKIYNSEIQKFNVENIIERLVENKSKCERRFSKKKNVILKLNQNMKYPFIEYMSYSLKKYGKKSYSYLKALEEVVEKTGVTVSDVIRKEHFDIAVNKVSIGNAIVSITNIQRINLLEIFEKVNGVEEILKQDPAGVYEKMDYKTKENYRNQIKKISKKMKVSEIYLTKKILEISAKNTGKKAHIGYYLVGNGTYELYNALGYKNKKNISFNTKVKFYIWFIIFFTAIISYITALQLQNLVNKFVVGVVSFILLLVPVSELTIQLVQYILSKVVKPKIIPKLDFYGGITEENSTFVVIPTIIKSKEKVKELMEKLEVFYLANKSKNLYFALLGDCSQSSKKYEKFDDEIIEEGLKQAKRLNEKYKTDGFDIFHFLYRERKKNESENCYLGWERKRGILNQFNDVILGKSKADFRVNTILENKMNFKIKYVITLDADTDLVLNSAFELVGAMAHILNKPVIDSRKNIVVDGYAIMQPRVGVNLDISNKNYFTKIFSGSGGIDSYTNAISDVYQDNFEEGIFTGKGIYDVEVFSKVLKDEIPENTVLSHDLLEGCYLRCALVTDVMLMDGYPSKYNSFMNRFSRWVRGDWQILKWLGSKLNLLSKYKIFDNLRRSIFEITILINIIFFIGLNMVYKKSTANYVAFMFFIVILPFLLEILNAIVFKKDGERTQKAYTPKIARTNGIIYRIILVIGCLPYKALTSQIAIIKTIYRMKISHKNLLEWTTSEEAEKASKTDVASFYKMMAVNLIFGILAIAFSIYIKNYLLTAVGILWIIAPYIMCIISKEKPKKLAIEYLNLEEKTYLLGIAKKTWSFFDMHLTKENNYLIPDNYQENRKEKIVLRTSSTNIGLSLVATISAYNLEFILLDESIEILNNILQTVASLQKFNGHLYNWYNIKTKKPLTPRYISTVDSGNFVGYMYLTKAFLEKVMQEHKENKIVIKEENFLVAQNLVNQILEIIKNTNFKFLYNDEQKLFHIGFNVEENKLTDSYYDLLASEARQASLIAIAKGDIPSRHWNKLGRTLTLLNRRKGLISWGGTAFEYLMPNINIPRYDGSLLDESCKFMIDSQIEYCKKLAIPWGISESAYNLKDLQSNYQYKAFGIPHLGIKRGLEDEIVVSSYASILAILDKPKEVVENLKRLENQGMYGNYGFFEAIDYTPQRLSKGKKYEVVKTYMAHHQALILLSINNLFNENILQKLFMQNPEMMAVSIILQERMPETFIITNQDKLKTDKIKYKDYENYFEKVYLKIDERLIRGNVISNENYCVAINQKGEGFSKYKDILINRFKETSENAQGIFFYIKNVNDKKILSSNYKANSNVENYKLSNKTGNYKVSFSPDKDKIEQIDGNIKVKMAVTLDLNEPVEIRRLEIENIGDDLETLEITSFFEPVLSNKEEDYAHQAFNNLFLVYEYDKETNTIIVKRKNREKAKKEMYLAVHLYTRGEQIGETEFEIDREKFVGRGNFKMPKAISQSTFLSSKIGLVTEPIIALKSVVKIKAKEKIYADLIISVNEEKDVAIKNLIKYETFENTSKSFELSKARCEAESRYLEIKGSQIELYQKMLSYILFQNPLKKAYMADLPKQIYYQRDLWKYGISGDSPIILVTIKDVNDMYVIKEVLKCFEYFNTKNIQIELVILNEEPHSYENYIKNEVEYCIASAQLTYKRNIKNGIFVLDKNDMKNEDINLIKFVASIIIDGHLGGIDTNINDLEEEYIKNCKMMIEEKIEGTAVENTKIKDINILENAENLKYYNEYGAFSKDGKEYLIRINKDNTLPAVWSHILANDKFGTVITENMGGYTWYKNSRLNRLTSWNNSSSMDLPSEVIYFKELNSGKTYSLGAHPMPDKNNYNVIYGFGYAKYIHQSENVIQELDVFVPENDSVKVNILTVKNRATSKKKFKIIYYIKPVLGEDEVKANQYIKVDMDNNCNIVWAENLYNRENLQDKMFISSSEKIKSYTGDKKLFLGEGGLAFPDGINKITLDNSNGLGAQSIVAVEIEFEVESLSNKQISIILGAEENLMDCKNMAYKYSKISNCYKELENVKNYWNNKLEKVKVDTPLESMNIILNGWSMYQTLASRLLGRSGFYQSGGAFGFRDQLQDTLSTKYIDPEILKNQIIKHSKKQFIEGDVLHWWHDETKRGIRTRFSDDLLWLAFCVIEYIKFTGDYSILDIETSYIYGETLEENEDERYDLYLPSEKQESIYIHCIRAINKSLEFGQNGLPKIGSGDWNDGLNTVGNKGKGESVWLGFFLYYILENFIEICKQKGELELENKYKIEKENLKIALNTNGWDGKWYKRAFMDDGNALGSIENDECQIDSIAQSWSVISGAGEIEKQRQAMESFENYLVDKNNEIIKLLDPPFEKGKLEPGYIKAYLPGVRENGGQYTHECCC